MKTGAAGVERAETATYTIPTDAPESDGTLEWDSTTLVLAEVAAGGDVGIGFTYGHSAAAVVIDETLAHAVQVDSGLADLRCTG